LMETGTIVVTGTATPHIFEDVPVRTEVISHKLIEKKQAVNLAEALDLHTGVRVENDCQNCNFTQVRILGFDGKYSQILINSDPVTSSVAGVYGLEHFPEEMIDRIEIVKGGGSALYGGDAIAGTVNLITRRPVINRVRLKYQGTSIDGESDQEVGAVAEMVNDGGTSGAYLFASTRKRNPYDRNNDGFSELGQLKNESIGFNWFYKPLLNGEFIANFHRINEERRGGNNFDLPPHEADIAESIEHWRWGGSVRWEHRPTENFNYRAYYSFSIIDRKSYFGGLSGNTLEERLEALNFYGKTENPLHVGGAQFNYYLGKHLLTSGLQYSRDKLNDQTVANPIYYIHEVYENYGIFLQDDFSFGAPAQYELVAGIRADKHSEINSWIWSPRLSGKFMVGCGFTLRTSISTGFKAPQTYDEDLHICGLEGNQKVIRNAKNLNPEKSYTLSGGIEFQESLGNFPVMFSVTGFYTRLYDAFTDRFVSSSGSLEFWERINSDGAEVTGFELDVGIRPFSQVEIRGGFTLKKSKYDTPLDDFNTTNFLRTPDIYGYVHTSYDITHDISFFASANFTGESDIPHEVPVEGQEEPDLILEKGDSFLQLDAGLSYELPMIKSIRLKLNTGIKNLTDTYQKDLDKTADRDPAYVYGPQLPRRFYWGLEVSF
jgi:outer membrane receptor for ferrienterochelin and colicins